MTPWENNQIITALSST